MGGISAAFNYHGAKFALAPWILKFIPAHRTYVEPYGGAAGVLLQKAQSDIEVYNDINSDVVNYFQVVRDRDLRRKLKQQILWTPYSIDEFKRAYTPDPAATPVERARVFLVRSYQGHGSSGTTIKTGFKAKSTGGPNAWAACPDRITTVGNRMRSVIIENRDALKVMADHDSPQTLHYVDPPYMAKTRKHFGAYTHELGDEDHARLLEFLCGLSGAVILSGYDNTFYTERLRGWETHKCNTSASGQKGSVERVETLWINPRCTRSLDEEYEKPQQVDMFNCAI